MLSSVFVWLSIPRRVFYVRKEIDCQQPRRTRLVTLDIAHVPFRRLKGRIVFLVFHTLIELFYEMICPECLVLMSSVASHPSLFSTSLVNTTPLAIDFVVELIVPHSFHHVDGNV